MYRKRNPLIVVLSGKSKSGKNLVASYIKEYFGGPACIEVAYAYHIKDYLKRMNKYDEQNKENYRSLLQEFGADFLLKEIDPKFLINRVREDISVFSYHYDVIIVTDARLVPEIKMPKEEFKNVVTIRITSNRDNELSNEQQKHITETGLDNYSDFDYIIENNTSIEELKNKVIKIMNEVK